MYAIIETGGKQYRVETGSLVQVESLPGKVGGTIELGQVRLVHSDRGMEVGQPLVKGATVKAEIIHQGRTRSITIFKKHGARTIGGPMATARALPNCALPISKRSNGNQPWQQIKAADQLEMGAIAIRNILGSRPTAERP